MKTMMDGSQEVVTLSTWRGSRLNSPHGSYKHNERFPTAYAAEVFRCVYFCFIHLREAQIQLTDICPSRIQP
jgi:hypothetical protein